MSQNNISWMGNKVIDRSSPPLTAPTTVIRQPSAVYPAPTQERDPQGVPDADDRMPGTPSPMMPMPMPSPIPGTMPPGTVIPEMQGPPTITDREYIPGYLMTLIGKAVRAEFIIGTDQYTDKTGTLTEVGANYFVLEECITRNKVMCDLYSVKFVTIIH